MADDEVEELLRAVQDEMILKLSVDSHTSRSSPDYLDPDLHSRFLALKSKKKDQQPHPHPHKPRPKSKHVEETPEDLMLRFAALKNSRPSSTSSSSSIVVLPDETGEDAEVEKLIQWAMDAARLDPSPPSEDDDDDGLNQSSDSDDSTRDVKP